MKTNKNMRQHGAPKRRNYLSGLTAKTILNYKEELGVAYISNNVRTASKLLKVKLTLLEGRKDRKYLRKIKSYISNAK